MYGSSIAFYWNGENCYFSSKLDDEVWVVETQIEFYSKWSIHYWIQCVQIQNYWNFKQESVPFQTLIDTKEKQFCSDFEK